MQTVGSLILLCTLTLASNSSFGETITATEGSGVWADPPANPTGAKVGTNGATVTVTTSTTTNVGNSAVVQYRIGTVNAMGVFLEARSFSQSIPGGVTEVATTTFNGLTQGVEYTVKAKVTFNGTVVKSYVDRTITVVP